jgi:hypothetical protein
MTTLNQRAELGTIAEYLIEHADLVSYAEIRPMATAHLKFADIKSLFAEGKPITMDCSEAVTLLFRLAGLKDPNGLNYNGAGFTGTLLEHLPRCGSLDQAHEGALVVFGAAPGTHVCMVMEHDTTDPWLFSHGAEIGPLKIRLSEEKPFHAGEPITLLSIASL